MRADAWRKGTQWAALTRPHAALIVADDGLFAAFARHCRTDATRFCAADEHYKQTLLHVRGRDAEVEQRPVTFAWWWPVTRAHPKRYVAQEAGPELLREMRAQTEFVRPLEGDHVDCGRWRNASTGAEEARPCWLFARKFSPLAGERIASFAAEVLGY